MISYRPRVIPCLLLKHGGLVKTIKFDKPNYLGDPINAVKIFNEKMVDELCIMDIEASVKGCGPDFSLLSDIATEAFMPLSYGGGITTIEEIRELFRIGLEKVILNTAFVKHPEIVKEAVSIAGSQSIVVSIDAKKNLTGRYTAFINDGKEKTSISPVELAVLAEKQGAGELIINSIDRDGKMQGYDLELIKNVTNAVEIPVVACGGAGNMQDIKSVLIEANVHAAAAGSMFVYYGKKKAVLINYPSENEFLQEGIYR